jgi:DNA invertase Pin-like site-specific DNA recombinase
MVAVKPGLRVVGYLRVSSHEQVEHGFGLADQKRAIEVWAAMNEAELVTFCTDAGVSGTDGLDGRDGLWIALSCLDSGVAEGVVVARLDRLARDVILQETLVRDIASKGHRLFSCMTAEQETLDDPTDPHRKLVRTILGAMAEFDRDMIRGRLMAGKRVKRAAGGYIGGQPPYGLMNGTNKDLVPHPDEMPVVERIVDMRSHGMGYQAIANVLNADGIPTKKGGQWYEMTVQRVITRAAPSLGYKGKRVGDPGRKPQEKARRHKPRKQLPPQPKVPPVVVDIERGAGKPRTWPDLVADA